MLTRVNGPMVADRERSTAVPCGWFLRKVLCLSFSNCPHGYPLTDEQSLTQPVSVLFTYRPRVCALRLSVVGQRFNTHDPDASKSEQPRETGIFEYVGPLFHFRLIGTGDNVPACRFTALFEDLELGIAGLD